MSGKNSTPFALNSGTDGVFRILQCSFPATTVASTRLQDVVTEAVATGSTKGRKRDKAKSYKCGVCDHSFRCKDHVVVHMRTHTGEKPFECKICKKRFTLRSNVSQHMNTHTAQRPFQCDRCGKDFMYRGCLYKHKLVHTGERPYGCGTCGRQFTHASQLLEHLRTHTNERPFKCAVCDRAFAHSGTMHRHRRNHFKRSRGREDVVKSLVVGSGDGLGVGTLVGDSSPVPLSNGADSSPVPLNNGADSSPVPLNNGADSSPVPLSNGADSSPVPLSNGADSSPVPLSNGADSSPVPLSNGADSNCDADVKFGDRDMNHNIVGLHGFGPEVDRKIVEIVGGDAVDEGQTNAVNGVQCELSSGLDHSQRVRQQPDKLISTVQETGDCDTEDRNTDEWHVSEGVGDVFKGFPMPGIDSQWFVEASLSNYKMEVGEVEDCEAESTSSAMKRERLQSCSPRETTLLPPDVHSAGNVGNSANPLATLQGLSAEIFDESASPIAEASSYNSTGGKRNGTGLARCADGSRQHFMLSNTYRVGGPSLMRKKKRMSVNGQDVKVFRCEVCHHPFCHRRSVLRHKKTAHPHHSYVPMVLPSAPFPSRENHAPLS